MRRPFLASMGCLWLALHPHHAVARACHYSSIELITAVSDVMVRGTIAEISPLEPERRPYNHYRFKLVIRVTETLKGPEVKEVSAAFDLLDPEFDSWRKDRKELLFSMQRCDSMQRTGGSSSVDAWCSNRSRRQRAGRNHHGLPRANGSWGHPESSTGGGRRRPGRRPQERTSPDPAVLDRPDERVCYRLCLCASGSTTRGTGRALGELEIGGLPCPRTHGISPFKSDRNIAILKRLLSDDFHTDVMHARDRGTRYYSARLPAYWVLKSWGVEVEKPVSEVPLRGIKDLVSRDRTDFSAIDQNWAEGGIPPSSAFSSPPSTPISMIPMGPPSPPER